MRLRIQTLSPLPDLKAWFIPQIQDVQETIFDLKVSLCNGVKPLRDSSVKAQNIALQLEGFELLDDSPISAARDGDLIFVKAKLSTDVDMDAAEPVKTRKRRRTTDESVGRYPSSVPNNIGKKGPARRKEDNSSDAESTSSESSSSSSSVSSSSESSSSSENTRPRKVSRTTHRRSATSSESSSSSESSHTTPPRKVKTANTHRQSTVNGPTNHIPPGQGRPATHSRNRRRKKRRELQKLSQAGSLPKPSVAPTGLSELNNLPLGSRVMKSVEPTCVPLPACPQSSELVPIYTSSKDPNHAPTTQSFVSTQRESQVELQDATASVDASRYTYITPDQVMMGSLRNKNKKRGFKQSMARPIPRKIVFSGAGGQQDLNGAAPAVMEEAVKPPGEPIGTLTGAESDRQTAFATQLPPRLIPPSELQELGKLPPNIFVTSVDVEEGMWGSSTRSKKDKKRKRKDQEEYGHRYHDGFDGEQNAWEGGLTYGGDEFAHGNGGVDPRAPSTSAVELVDWAEAEKVWDASPVLQNPDELTVGALVGWKNLAINPQTFTPELLLSLAHVAAVDKPKGLDDVDAIQICVHPIKRMGASQAAFAFGVVASGDSGVGDENERLDIYYNWTDALSMQWKLVRL